MADTYLIGIDFGSESARGILVNSRTGAQEGHHVHPYSNGILTTSLMGHALPANFVLQVPSDYTEAAQQILFALGAGKTIDGIGIDFTASSPMPARADGTALAELHPDDPHAYVKLWKHSAQSHADAINAGGGEYLENFGGKLSGEWLIAKAAQLSSEAPAIWDETERFIEAGDWLVWQLTGNEMRSLDFAAYKAQFSAVSGYPEDVVAGLTRRLSQPAQVGSPAGTMTAEWRLRTGIQGDAIVSVAVIDSHVVLPAVGAVEPGVFVGALGTSAGFLILDDKGRGFPTGLEGAAFGAVLPNLWCYEAGQAAFGDMLAWYVKTFPRDPDLSRNFASYNEAAQALGPGEGGVMALDWFAGNRIPLADSALSGLLVGLSLKSTAAGIYRALIEALCFGTKTVLELALAAGVPIRRVIMTSGLTRSNPFLVQTMADVLGRTIEVPDIENPTALGAAIHGAVAAGIVSSFAKGAEQLGARSLRKFEPNEDRLADYQVLYAEYRRLAADEELRRAMRSLHMFDARNRQYRQRKPQQVEAAQLASG
ncbi:FGGY-family carbohydrate kinase [Rhizobium nepotum]|uniref:FGGY-family carbohydrate kinase n=1 Tax=Rhizobium nepotum TaxID=1035271 RepID=UPI00336ADD34